MDFRAALQALKMGGRARRPYFAPGTWLILVPGSQFEVMADRPLGQAAPELVGRSVSYEPHIDFVGPYGVHVWTASHSDLLATDWEVMTPHA